MIPQVVWPGWTISCEPEHGCVQTTDLRTLLPERARNAARDDPQALVKLTAYAARPMIRSGLAGLIVVREGLMVFLLLAIGTMLLRFGRRSDQVLVGALPSPPMR